MKNRRDFLRSSLFALAGTTFFAKPVLAHADKESQMIKQTHFAMGTLVTFTLAHNSKEEAYEAVASAMLEIQRLEKIFSRHNKSSELSILNEKGALINASQELIYVLDKSVEISRKTDEVYNPLVKPMLDLFEQNQNIHSWAQDIAKSDILHASELSKLSALKIENNTIKFTRSGMGLTLDSLAKGYIIDKASEILIAKNVKNHIINAGGDIIVKGKKSAKEAWIVGIENPENPNQALASFAMEDMALATSGSYQKYFDKAKERHHIINPSSMKSPKVLTISCKASKAMLADAYATVCALNPHTQYNQYKV